MEKLLSSVKSATVQPLGVPTSGMMSGTLSAADIESPISTAEKTECQGAPAAKPYIGCNINLISMLDIRYEGTLHSVNGDEKTFTLAQVRSFGTEDRPVVCRVEAPEKVYQFVVFKATNVKDMCVTESNMRADLGLDPAVITYKPTYFSQGNRNFASGGGGSLNGSPMSGGAKRDMRRRMDDMNGGGGGGGNNGFYGNRSAMNNRAMKTGVFEANKFGNKANASTFTSDYDYMRANEVFKEKMEQMSKEEKNEQHQIDTHTMISEIAEAIGDKKPKENESTEVHLNAVYNKKVCFFDNISCETVEKSEGTYRPHDWQTERKVNQQTFGFSGMRRPFGMFNRNRPLNAGGGGGGGFNRGYRRPYNSYQWAN